jgi:DNA-binding MarR family transcriptional regulator
MNKTIEEEIRQKKFRNSQQRVQLNILFSAGWIFTQHAVLFKQHGITNQQYNVLRILRGSLPGACSQLEIRSRMLDRMSDTSRLVDRLEKNGYVKRETNRQDRRTQSGLDLLAKMELDEYKLDEITKNLTDDESNTLCILLDKMRG